MPVAGTDTSFEARARAVLSSSPMDMADEPAVAGDHVIAGIPLGADFVRNAKPAAVLIPVMQRQDSYSILLTERAAHLSTHAGQVAFPGGRIDAGETAFAAALREAEEEIGLPPSAVEPLGFLPSYVSGTGFRVQPLVALVSTDPVLRPNPDEVGRIFEIPLDLALDLGRYRTGTVHWREQDRRFFILDYPEAYIWGVTAGILRSFAERYST
jgi:8-oxo-dGTP pyrophosphatase MutT (NUDIX family)